MCWFFGVCVNRLVQLLRLPPSRPLSKSLTVHGEAGGNRHYNNSLMAGHYNRILHNMHGLRSKCVVQALHDAHSYYMCDCGYFCSDIFQLRMPCQFVALASSVTSL